jgi:glycosyltransferase involved in cell wall biosynthesis
MKSDQGVSSDARWRSPDFDWLGTWTAAGVPENPTSSATEYSEPLVEVGMVERDGKIASLTGVIAERDAQIVGMAQEISELHRQARDIRDLKEVAEGRIVDLLSSRSWRITKPLRLLARTIRHRRIFPSDLQRLVEALRYVYRLMPLPQWLRRGLRPYARSALTKLGIGNLQYQVICFPIIDWDFRFQRPQQLMTQFARSGHKVHYVGLNFRPTFSTREICPGIEEVWLPGPAVNPYGDRLDDATARAAADVLIRHCVLSASSPVLCVLHLPFWLPIAEELAKRVGARIIYDCMDDHAGFTNNKEEMLASEPALIGRADLLVTSSRLLYDKLRGSANRTVLIRNAADFSHFDAVRVSPNHNIESPCVGYFGAIDHWFDIALMAGIARARPTWKFKLIGSTAGADAEPLRNLSNVELFGEIPHAKLPDLLHDWDCCVIPFLRCPLTEATNPVKVYEMLAAGKPVVAVPLPELLTFAKHGLIRVANNAGEFVDAVEKSLRDDNQHKISLRKAFAAQNTWERRFTVLEREIGRI